MAYEGQQITIPGLIAGGTLTSSQYLFVKLSAAKTVVVCSGTTDIPIGVLQNAPAYLEAAVVCAVGVTKVQGDANLGYGDVIGTSADAQAAAVVAGTNTTVYACGVVIDDNATAGGLATAAINCLSPGRGA